MSNSWDWKSLLANKLQKVQSLVSHESLDSLAQDYLTLKDKIGKAVNIPTKDSGEGEYKDFYNKVLDVPGVIAMPNPKDDDSIDRFFGKLGRPKLPEEYKFSSSVTNKLKADPDFMKQVTTTFHKYGLSQDQAHGLLETLTADMKEYDVERELYLNLKTALGDKVDAQARLDQSITNMEKISESRAELKELMANPRFKYNPAIVEVFAGLDIKRSEKSGEPVIQTAPPPQVEEETDKLSTQINEYLETKSF